MSPIYPIIFLLACGTLYLHLRLSHWRSKYKSLALALNLIFPLAYIPVLMNFWWASKTLGNYFISPAAIEWIVLAIMAVTLFSCHYYYASKLKEIDLPRVLVRLFWPSFLLPALCFINGIVIKTEMFAPRYPNLLHLQAYLSYINVSLVLVPILLAVYLVFFAYVGFKVDQKNGTFAKIRACWQKFAFRFFSHAGTGGE